MLNILNWADMPEIEIYMDGESWVEYFTDPAIGKVYLNGWNGEEWRSCWDSIGQNYTARPVTRGEYRGKESDLIKAAIGAFWNAYNDKPGMEITGEEQDMRDWLNEYVEIALDPK